MFLLCTEEYFFFLLFVSLFSFCSNRNRIYHPVIGVKIGFLLQSFIWKYVYWDKNNVVVFMKTFIFSYNSTVSLHSYNLIQKIYDENIFVGKHTTDH